MWADCIRMSASTISSRLDWKSFSHQAAKSMLNLASAFLSSFLYSISSCHFSFCPLLQCLSSFLPYSGSCIFYPVWLHQLPSNGWGFAPSYRADNKLNFKPPQTELVMETSPHNQQRERAGPPGSKKLCSLQHCVDAFSHFAETGCVSRRCATKPQISSNGAHEFKLSHKATHTNT